ncbi:unnamed protein product [Oppiella nova]|uniref:Platelet-derived growth factor (PDGF) family profile domain-containing protein n=1 Tax=Oppiella nova TaxID=334625 RepID=A0A7R9M9M2_9ACAR|nr:unnamed protein product [Oppiella nova]CAG2173078.1 unnamed protein product [Oppiella nova]
MKSSEDSLESVLIRTSHMTDVNDLLQELGLVITGRLRGSAYGVQAVCAPELRTVELEDSPDGDHNSIYFPKCVRIKRCGGCCGASQLLECSPTKKSYKTVRRAHIRMKRSADGRPLPNLSHHSVSVEEHEECGCQCRVGPQQCDPFLHRYRLELCRCECLNARDQLECKSLGTYRIWDSSECRCKCIVTKLCSTGYYFDDHTCSCIEEEYKH